MGFFVFPTPVIATTTPAIAQILPVKAPIQATDVVFERIAICESGNVSTAKNPNSSASGRFQFIKSSWIYYGTKLWGDKLAEKNVMNYDDNTELARYAYKLHGVTPWEASRHCWSK